MPIPVHRWPDNVEGRFYISHDGVIGAVCADIAPMVFRLSHTEDHNVSWRQPTTDLELTLALEARDNCPVEAVRDDG